LAFIDFIDDTPYLRVFAEDFSEEKSVKIPFNSEYYYPETYESEEYVQTLVKERVQDIEEKIGDFSVKYGELDSRIQQIYEQLSLLTKKKPGEEQLLSTKLDALKDMVDDVSTRLNSLERAFKETLPALIESVRALSDLVQRFKKEA